MMSENTILQNNHILICIDEQITNTDQELNYIKNNFCGVVISKLIPIKCRNTIIYMCGDIQKNTEIIDNELIFVIKEYSYNYSEQHNLITSGETPINIHNVGIYFRQLFPTNKNYFELIIPN